MTIWERVKSALTSLGLPMAANSYLSTSAAELPDRYLVYQLISDPALLHADDVEKVRSYRVQVTIYSRSGLAGIPNVVGAMVTAGFTRLPAREMPYHEETRHYGLAMDFGYVEDA